MKNYNKLLGKTIKKLRRRGIKNCDDKPFLDIYFTDGSKATIVGDYGMYTGASQDEYRRFIYIK